MKIIPSTYARQLSSRHAPGADTAAVVTLAAAVGVRHVVDWVYWGYDQPTTAIESITIVIGATTKLVLPIPIGAATALSPPRYLPFPGGLYGDENEAVVVTLTAGGGTLTGTVIVGYR